MEGNRDEAKRCIDIAYKYLRAGNLDRARKFLIKAEQLYPSVQGQKLLDDIDALNNEEKMSNGAAPQEDPPSQDEAKYTQDQVDLVKKVKKCKSFYEMLGVTKESTDSEIRKAYKKLALHLHPDKNRAPGAAEAFKAVGNAVAVLTDAEKRKAYDLYGSEVPSRGGSARHRHHSHDYYRQFESDATAEELFNMFFGDGFTNSGHRRFRNQHHESNQPSLAFGLILIIVISLMSTFLISDPIYSLQPSTKYSITKKTSSLGVPYYVKRNFEEEYTGTLARLELAVEEEYLIGMKKLCMRERHYRDAMMSRAQHFGSKAQYVQAQSLKTPSCDTLYHLGKM